MMGAGVHFACGAFLLAVAAILATYVARNRLSDERKRCVERGFAVILHTDKASLRPFIQLFPSEGGPIRFYHARPYLDPEGNPFPYGHKVVAYYDPADPAMGPHLLADELRRARKENRNMSILAATAALAGIVLVATGIAPP